MKYICSLVILVVGFSQAFVMARGLVRMPRVNLNKTQDFIKDVRVNHAIRARLEQSNKSINEAKETQACKNDISACTEFLDRSVAVMEVLANSSSSGTNSQIAGALASRAAEVLNEWVQPSKEGYIIWNKGFLLGKRENGPSVNHRVNKGTEMLLELPQNMLLDTKISLIRDKVAKIKRDCL